MSKVSKAPLKSKLYLPKLEMEVSTIFEYLINRFVHLDPNILAERIKKKDLCFADGTHVLLNSPYQQGATIFYYREVEEEFSMQVEEKIIFQNDEIVIADKPHFIPVTPSGKYLNQTLLYRLINKYGFEELSPVHRLDKDTAGLVLFSKRKRTRAAYHNLFQHGQIDRKYVAVCKIKSDCQQTQWIVRNRITQGVPWYKMKIEQGEANAFTSIKLIHNREGNGLFWLEPKTGKKHQLRLHLSSLGFDIVDDPIYPEVIDFQGYDNPMQLLAKQLSFLDPITGQEFTFWSEQRLKWPI